MNTSMFIFLMIKLSALKEQLQKIAVVNSAKSSVAEILACGCFSIKKRTLAKRRSFAKLYFLLHAMPRLNENAQQVLLHPRSFSHI